MVFTAFFAYTFLGRQHIDGMARSFVSAKTEHYARPAVDMASDALQTELAQRLLTKDLKDAIAAEIAEFRTNPTRFILRLTAAAAPEKPPAFLAKLSERIYGWKERIRAHYDKVLRRLFTDLRIFAGSNIVAAGIAFACALRSPQDPSLRLKLCSALLLISVGFTAYLYINSFSFFTILFNGYLGWWYPLLLVVIFFRLLIDSGAALLSSRPE